MQPLNRAEGNKIFRRDPKLTIRLCTGGRFFLTLLNFTPQLLQLITVTLTEFLKWKRRLNGDGETVLTLAAEGY